MKIRPPVAVALGTAAGLLAAGLVYSASAGASPNESPASAVLPRVATTTTVTPSAQPTCSGKAELEHGVCVVTVDETATTAPSTSSGHQGSGSEHSSTPRATRTSEHQGEDANEQGDDQGEHAEEGDDHGGDHAEDGDDHGDHSGEQGDDSEDHGGDGSGDSGD